MRGRSKFKVLGILWGSALFTLVLAQDAPLSLSLSSSVELDDLVNEALSRNPRIQAAEKEWQAALEKVPQAKALPDPMLSYGHFFRSIETRLGPQRNKFSLSQRFPFFGKLSLKERIAAEQAAVLEEHFQQASRDVVLLVKEAFFSLHWMEEAVRIAQQEKESLQRLSVVALKKYETGAAAQQDALKAQLEISKLSDRILTLRQGRHAAETKLMALLNRDRESGFGPIQAYVQPALSVDLETLLIWAEQTRPELRRAEKVIAKNDLDLELAKKNYWPDFNVMLDYFEIGSGNTTQPDDGGNAWMASVGINIPLWRGKLRAAEAEAALRLKASQDIRSDLQNDTSARVIELYHEVKMLEEQAQLYQFSLLPQAEQTFKSAEISYIAGKADFLSILDAERMLIQLRTAYAKLAADRGKTWARLERVVGQKI